MITAPPSQWRHSASHSRRSLRSRSRRDGTGAGKSAVSTASSPVVRASRARPERIPCSCGSSRPRPAPSPARRAPRRVRGPTPVRRVRRGVRVGRPSLVSSGSPFGNSPDDWLEYDCISKRECRRCPRPSTGKSSAGRSARPCSGWSPSAASTRSACAPWPPRRGVPRRRPEVLPHQGGDAHVRRRAGRRTGRAPDGRGGHRAAAAPELRELVLTTLPVDAERRAEATAQLAFAVHAAHHPRLAAIRRQVDRDVRDALASWLESTGYGTRATAVADAVIALSDGLALRMLYSPREHAHLLTVLDRALDALIQDGGTTVDPDAPSPAVRGRQLPARGGLLPFGALPCPGAENRCRTARPAPTLTSRRTVRCRRQTSVHPSEGRRPCAATPPSPCPPPVPGTT